MSKLLVTDFDGTITEHDFYERALEHIDRRGMPDYWSLYAAGRITHFEAMQGIFARIRTSAGEMTSLIASLNPDPILRPSVERLRTGGWEIVVVSAGSSWYIDRILRACGVELTVYASKGTFTPGQGLALHPPLDSPFYSPSHGIDKCAVVADGLANYDVVAFAGNGPPDLEPSLMTPPSLRFARTWLADALAARGEGFRPFDRWSEIADALLAE